MALGAYISVPFCRTKCSYCNFASDVFSEERMQSYVDRVCRDMASSEALARALGAIFSPELDTVYFGGGTPNILGQAQLRQLFESLRQNFSLCPNAEITVECAPATLSAEFIHVLAECGVNRVSLGVQSFNNCEARSVGRLHTAEAALR